MNEYTTAEVRALAQELEARAKDGNPVLTLARNMLIACADGRVFPDQRVRGEVAAVLEAT